MNHDLLLLLAGSFLPNNMFVWVFKWLRKKVRGDKHSFSIIAARRYYAKFESDPATQYGYHKKMQRFWLLNFVPMNVLVGADIWAIVTGHTPISLLTTAILLAINTNYSLYANFDTETGDAHAAYASLRLNEVKANQEDDMPEGIPEDQLDSIVDQLEPWALPEPAE